MSEVAQTGRTVLFVSHNMGAVQSLCEKALLLVSGRVACRGPSSEIIKHYLTGSMSRKEKSDEVRLGTDLALLSLGFDSERVVCGDSASLELKVQCEKPLRSAIFAC